MSSVPMSNFTPKLFCPLLSTPSKKVYCDNGCMWYVHNDDLTGKTCSVALLLQAVASKAGAEDEVED